MSASHWLSRVRRGAAFAAMAWLSLPTAHAQSTYKCTREGAVFYTDRPCSNNLESVKPAGTSLSDEKRHWAHMSPGCLKLARTVDQLQQQTHRTSDYDYDYDYRRADRELAAARARYYADCRDEEYEARRRTAEADRAERGRHFAERQHRADALAQCSEMRRIREAQIARRASMTANEWADFERFDANFIARCQGLAPR